jgi:hypothetical protein
VVVHKDQFATWLGHAQRLGNGLAPHLGRLLMQQEKHHNCIVAAVFEVQIGGVLQRGIDMLRVAQLGLQVLDLDGCHINHIHPTTGAEPTHQVFGKVAVDTGDLQHTTVDDLPHLLQCRIPQPGKVAPQNQVNQPLALEDMDRPGVQIGPPIGVVQVFGDDCWGRNSATQRLERLDLSEGYVLFWTHKWTLNLSRRHTAAVSARGTPGNQTQMRNRYRAVRPVPTAATR